jgi:quercetin 2,3-dioxygenase
MIQIRKSQDRGLADHGWLKSYHTFSFADYYNPRFMGFRDLRVINEDRIAGGTGFDAHPHSNMEIISYVIKGGLQHKDSMGNATMILPDEVQVMSAGTGINHSEYNYSKTEQGHFLQIWILPNQSGVTPRYGQRSFKEDLAQKNLVLAVSGDGRDGSIMIHQDADVYIGRMRAEQSLDFSIRPGRYGWVQMIKGSIQLNKQNLDAGDAAALSDEASLNIKAVKESEFMVFDLK